MQIRIYINSIHLNSVLYKLPIHTNVILRQFTNGKKGETSRLHTEEAIGDRGEKTSLSKAETLNRTRRTRQERCGRNQMHCTVLREKHSSRHHAKINLVAEHMIQRHTPQRNARRNKTIQMNCPSGKLNLLHIKKVSVRNSIKLLISLARLAVNFLS